MTTNRKEDGMHGMPWTAWPVHSIFLPCTSSSLGIGSRISRHKEREIEGKKEKKICLS